MRAAETLHPDDLSDADAEAWRALCAATPAFESPLLGPDFTRAVGRVRDDARVTLWRRDGRLKAAFAYHRRPGGLGRAIGAPLSDYHGLVQAPDFRLEGAQALAAAGLSAWRFNGLVDPFGAFAAASGEPRDGYVVRTGGQAEAYLEALRAASPKRFKNYRRLDHKLEREVGPITLVAADQSREAYERLLAWKRDQLHRTGAHNFFHGGWTQRLFDRFFDEGEGPLQGLAMNLYAGGRLVAGHFGVRLGDVYHPWIASADPELAAWSPGQVFLGRAIAAMPGVGLRVYDLGPGHAHYKAPYARDVTRLAEGLATADSPAGRAARASDALWTAGARRSRRVGRLRRRLDHIASVELTLRGRAYGFADALAAQTRKSLEAEG
ncbi:MAG: GNAT family N-acetyltransferase [Caulobacteraceae bacterium]|nr:GNAT family N-acetyltransferase [Caulobacteraceae bacterium]